MKIYKPYQQVIQHEEDALNYTKIGVGTAMGGGAFAAYGWAGPVVFFLVCIAMAIFHFVQAARLSQH